MDNYEEAQRRAGEFNAQQPLGTIKEQITDLRRAVCVVAQAVARIQRYVGDTTEHHDKLIKLIADLQGTPVELVEKYRLPTLYATKIYPGEPTSNLKVYSSQYVAITEMAEDMKRLKEVYPHCNIVPVWDKTIPETPPPDCYTDGTSDADARD
jgi:hypothetical protein